MDRSEPLPMDAIIDLAVSAPDMVTDGEWSRLHASTVMPTEGSNGHFVGAEFGLGIADHDAAELGLQEVHRFRGDI